MRGMQSVSGLASRKDEQMTITYEPKKVAVFLGILIVCLIMANMVGIFSKYYFGYSRIALFDLDREENVPTLYSSATLLISSGLLAVIAAARKRQKKGDYLYWAGLAVVFLFLSIDETAGLHERLIKPLRSALHTSGILFYAWVIPYGIFLIAMMLIYLRFLFSLAVRFRYLIIFAGILYVAGALGGELIGGYWAELYSVENITYALITTCEESLEMAGVLVFIYALMSYITSELNDLYFHIGSVINIPKQGLEQLPLKKEDRKSVFVSSEPEFYE
jgi:hypothetical protein